MPPKSGLYYPNKIARIYLLALEEVMGENGVKAVRVEQVQCKSMGHENSVFHIYKEPLD